MANFRPGRFSVTFQALISLFLALGTVHALAQDGLSEALSPPAQSASPEIIRDWVLRTLMATELQFNWTHSGEAAPEATFTRPMQVYLLPRQLVGPQRSDLPVIASDSLLRRVQFATVGDTVIFPVHPEDTGYRGQITSALRRLQVRFTMGSIGPTSGSASRSQNFIEISPGGELQLFGIKPSTNIVNGQEEEKRMLVPHARMAEINSLAFRRLIEQEGPDIFSFTGGTDGVGRVVDESAWLGLREPNDRGYAVLFRDRGPVSPSLIWLRGFTFQSEENLLELAKMIAGRRSPSAALAILENFAIDPWARLTTEAALFGISLVNNHSQNWSAAFDTINRKFVPGLELIDSQDLEIDYEYLNEYLGRSLTSLELTALHRKSPRLFADARSRDGLFSSIERIGRDKLIWIDTSFRVFGEVDTAFDQNIRQMFMKSQARRAAKLTGLPIHFLILEKSSTLPAAPDLVRFVNAHHERFASLTSAMAERAVRASPTQAASVWESEINALIVSGQSELVRDYLRQIDEVSQISWSRSVSAEFNQSFFRVSRVVGYRPALPSVEFYRQFFRFITHVPAYSGILHEEVGLRFDESIANTLNAFSLTIKRTLAELPDIDSRIDFINRLLATSTERETIIYRYLGYASPYPVIIMAPQPYLRASDVTAIKGVVSETLRAIIYAMPPNETTSPEFRRVLQSYVNRGLRLGLSRGAPLSEIESAISRQLAGYLGAARRRCGPEFGDDLAD